MTFDEYQQEAIKTRQAKTSLLYCATKLHCEAGELAQPIIKEVYHSKSYDKVALMDEAGDCLWYLANIAYILGISFDKVAEYNIEKLRERHGEIYNPSFYQK